jgi:hypothetical protein
MKRQSLPKPKILNPWPPRKRRANKEAIEWELKTYKAMRQEIDEVMHEIDEMAASSARDIRESIYTKSKEMTFPGGFNTSVIIGKPVRNANDPTADKAEQIRRYRELRLGGTEYREMVRRINAIERVMERLERSGLRDFNQLAVLIKRRYFDQEDMHILMGEFNISRKTFYRKRDLIITKIAKELGFVI